MKVIKVIVDEMPEFCHGCPLNEWDGCGDWDYEDEGCRVPDHRCLCEVEGEGE